jgi:hypothetical protein
MRRRGVRVTAATYLPLFVALRKARRIPRIDRMEELQDEMEGQGIKPSAEVRTSDQVSKVTALSKSKIWIYA